MTTLRIALRITLRLAALLLLLAPLAALRAGDDGPIVGAIRWDGWYGDGTVTKAVEASLGQPKYHFRLPWFAQLQSDGSVRINGDSQATLSGANLNITYWVPTLAANAAFPLRIEFFIADANNQEGKTFLGSDSYTTPGAKLATISAGATIVGTKIVATATDANGNTSEFSVFATVA